MALHIGDEAPNFTAKTTAGTIDFHKWYRRRLGHSVLPSEGLHPDLHDGARLHGRSRSDFAKRNTKIIGVSVDTVEDHEKWIKDIEETQGNKVTYPIIDGSDLKIAKAYDMLPRTRAARPRADGSDNATVRSVFVIGPDKKIKATLTYR
jgi:alkyl hydroperoxide reductase subunit AhpC